MAAPIPQDRNFNAIPEPGKARKPVGITEPVDDSIEVDISKPQVMLESPNLRFLTSYRTALLLASKSSKTTISDYNKLKKIRTQFQDALYDRGTSNEKGGEQERLSQPEDTNKYRAAFYQTELEGVEKEINKILQNPYQNKDDLQGVTGSEGNIEQFEYEFMKKSNDVLKESLEKLVKQLKKMDIPKEAKDAKELFNMSQLPQYRNFEYPDSYKFIGKDKDEEQFTVTVRKDPISPDKMREILGNWDNSKTVKGKKFDLMKEEDKIACNKGVHTGSKYRGNVPSNVTETKLEMKGSDPFTIYSHSDLSPEKEHFKKMDPKAKETKMQSITTQNNEAVFLRAMNMKKETDPSGSKYIAEDFEEKVYCTTSLLSNAIEQDMTDLKQHAMRTIRDTLSASQKLKIKIFSFNFPVNALNNEGEFKWKLKITGGRSHKLGSASTQLENAKELYRLINYAKTGNDNLPNEYNKTSEEDPNKLTKEIIQGMEHLAGENEQLKDCVDAYKKAYSYRLKYFKEDEDFNQDDKHFMHLNQKVNKLVHDLPSYRVDRNLKADNVKPFFHCKSGKDRTFGAIIHSCLKELSSDNKSSNLVESHEPGILHQLYRGLGRSLHGLYDNPGCTGIKTISPPSILGLIGSKLFGTYDHGDEKSALFDQTSFDELYKNGNSRVAEICSSWNSSTQWSSVWQSFSTLRKPSDIISGSWSNIKNSVRSSKLGKFFGFADKEEKYKINQSSKTIGPAIISGVSLTGNTSTVNTSANVNPMHTSDKMENKREEWIKLRIAECHYENLPTQENFQIKTLNTQSEKIALAAQQFFHTNIPNPHDSILLSNIANPLEVCNEIIKLNTQGDTVGPIKFDPSTTSKLTGDEQQKLKGLIQKINQNVDLSIPPNKPIPLPKEKHIQNDVDGKIKDPKHKAVIDELKKQIGGRKPGG
ncbi:MAG TPA: hypothetical protein QF353_04590 [Gammaproteobacteria bacterium]|nr:hypothetical protein [Gammaproteobacteria bacterium]